MRLSEPLNPNASKPLTALRLASSAKLACLLFAFAFAFAFCALGPHSTNAAKGSRLPQSIERVKRAVVIVEALDARGATVSRGSGFFVRDDRIVTNLHVVGRATAVRVTTYAGETLSVEGVVALEERRDLALLQVGTASAYVETLTISEASPLAGEAVFVVSNPLGSPWDVSRGTTLVPRVLPDIGRLLPITAPISRGSSGGPVVNQSGQVVGVAALRLKSDVEEYFALPCEAVASLRPDALRPFPLSLP